MHDRTDVNNRLWSGILVHNHSKLLKWTVNDKGFKL